MRPISKLVLSLPFRARICPNQPLLKAQAALCIPKTPSSGFPSNVTSPVAFLTQAPVPFRMSLISMAFVADGICGRHSRLADQVGIPYSSYMGPLRARVEKGRLVLDEPTTLPEGTVVDLVADDEGDDLTNEERRALNEALSTSWRSAEAGSLQPASRILDELRRQR